MKGQKSHAWGRSTHFHIPATTKSAAESETYTKEASISFFFPLIFLGGEREGGKERETSMPPSHTPTRSRSNLHMPLLGNQTQDPLMNGHRL